MGLLQRGRNVFLGVIGYRRYTWAAPCSRVSTLAGVWLAMDNTAVPDCTSTWAWVRAALSAAKSVSVLGISAISVADDSHSAYGPGMRGYGRYVGVSLTQDMTGEFFGTFLIPSVVHQDPHYHRMPLASITRRAFHCVDQVVWTQGDNGSGMVNYADLAGFAIDGGLSNLYVPGQRDNLPSSVARYFIGLGTAPIDNCVVEFLPDIARHIHVQVVIIQRIINQVSINSQP